jgi:hypothetical protein
MKVSIIIPFVSLSEKQRGHLHTFKNTNYDTTVLTTIEAIRNINKVLKKIDKEIILVDNTHNFPKVTLPNLKIVKGWQGYTKEELRKQPDFEKYNINVFNNSTMWASMAYNIGIQHAKGDYIICQHNDIFYHNECVNDMINYLEKTKIEYISADYKKMFISGYVMNKERIDSIFEKKKIEIDFSPFDGGYIKTEDFGVADCYFFLCRKEFFDDYYVDWGFGDTNHGATIKCLENDKRFYHLTPFYDNPNFDTTFNSRTYKWFDRPFCTHLKGGFSEFKITKNGDEYQNYMRYLLSATYDR